MSDVEIPFLWTRRFSIGLTCSVAAFAAWGALAPHFPGMTENAPLAAGVLMAAFYANAQGLANCSASNLRCLGARRRVSYPGHIFLGLLRVANLSAMMLVFALTV